jgi:hypothetical protein
MPVPGTWMESAGYLYFQQTNNDSAITPENEAGAWTGSETKANSFVVSTQARETVKVALLYQARQATTGQANSHTVKFETTIFGCNTRDGTYVSQGKTHTNYIYPANDTYTSNQQNKTWTFNTFTTYWYIRVKTTCGAEVLDTAGNETTIKGRVQFSGGTLISRTGYKTKTMVHGSGLQVMTGEDQYIRFGRNQNLINGDLAVSGSTQAGGTGYFTNNLTVGDIEANTSYPMYVVGDLAATGNIIAYVSSDERLKDNINPLSDSLEKLKNITPVDFSWKDHSKGWGSESPRDIGLLAQDVEKEFPTIVGTMNDGYKGIRYDRLVPVLVDSIQTQDKKIEKLEGLVEKLINELEEK